MLEKVILFATEVVVSTAVIASNLCKSYKKVNAVQNVSFTINQGEIVGLIGKNGAGKTTLIRLLSGLTKPTSGQFLLLDGQPRNDYDVAAIVESPPIYKNMTAMDNLEAQSLLLGLPIDKEYMAQTLNLVGLDPNNKQKAKNYSLGMRQRLAIAITLIGKPKLLLLDEPTNGLDPQGIRDMRQIFVDINKQLGTTLLISSHILSELGKFATQFLFMDKGCLIKDISASELLQAKSKKIKLSVNNVDAAKSILDSLGVCKIISSEFVEFSGEVPATQLVVALANNDIEVKSFATVGDNLEDYFLQLIADNGGEK